MFRAIQKDPKAANEFLSYAYGLGFCQGREVTALQLLNELDKHSPNAASGLTKESK